MSALTRDLLAINDDIRPQSAEAITQAARKMESMAVLILTASDILAREVMPNRRDLSVREFSALDDFMMAATHIRREAA